LTTKLHLACDGKGRILAVALTPGQWGDNPQLPALLDAISVPRLGGGQPRSRPDRLIADKGYSHPSTRRLLRRRRIPHIIPERLDQRARRRGHPGRPPAFDATVYRRRNVVERCVNRLKQWRGLATRFEKRAANFRAAVTIAALLMWL
jgi:transposase